MIERYTIKASRQEIEERYQIQFSSPFEKTYNASPTQVLPVITSSKTKQANLFHWGVEPGISKRKSITSKLINAPLESLTDIISYKKALFARRCIIPANGFYVWKSIQKEVKFRIIYRLKTTCFFQ